VLDQDEMIAITNAYVDAYKRNDKQALLALFAADAVFEDPVGTPPNVGHEGIGAFWDQAHALAQIELRSKDVIVCGREMVMQLEIAATVENSTMLIDAIDVVTVNDAGKIATLKAYWDMSKAH